MANNQQDVNPDEVSSTSSVTAGGQQTEDVISDSSSQEQSTQTQDEKAETSMLDAVKETLKQQGDTVSDVEETETEAKESDSETETDAKDAKDTEGKTEKDGEKKEEKKDETETKGEKEEALDHEKAVPYERFAEVNTKAKTLEQQLQEQSQEVQNYRNITDFCRKFSITAEQHENAMRLMALQNTDPEKAVELLKKELENLQGFVDGGKLPEDLQKKVDDGRMELEDAQEIAKLRAQGKVEERRRQSLERSQQENQQAQLEQQMRRDSHQWVESKMKSDPDFLPKKDEKSPDGKFELVFDRYNSLITRTKVENGKQMYAFPVNSSKDMVDLMDRAYKEINATFSRLTTGGRKPTKPTLTSSGSSSVKSKKDFTEAETMAEAVKMSLAESGGKLV